MNMCDTISVEVGQRPLLERLFRRTATEADSLPQFLLCWLTCFCIVLSYFWKVVNGDKWIMIPMGIIT
jgi:hypothetical protein